MNIEHKEINCDIKKKKEVKGWSLYRRIKLL